MTPRTLQEKQDEKDRLLKKYRYAKRRQWLELCEREPRMPALRKAIRRTRTPGETISLLATSWVRNADSDTRLAALQEVNGHAERMARYEGRAPLDDPFPPEMNVFLIAREMLAVR